jgi:transcription-repair coupling factor (superfamily II helicase)
VRDLRGEVQTESLWPIDVRWPVDQYLPEAYVPVESQRIRFYKDLAAARTLDELEMIREELLDRYGGLPPEGVNLLNAFQVKLALAPWHVDAVRADLPAPDDPRRDSEPGVIRLVKCERPRELAEALDAARQPRDGIDRIAYRADGSVRLYPTDADRSPEALLADFARLASTLPAPDRIPVGAMSRG